MKTASLLAASAGILVLATAGARAEAPLEYVKVCDVFGSGFFYIPGSEACIKIGGYVRGEVGGEFNSDVVEFGGKIHPEFDLRAMTRLGELQAFLSLDLEAHSTTGGGISGDDEFEWGRDEAYLSLGPILGGWKGSTYDYESAYTYIDAYQSSATVLQARYTWLTRGYTIAVAIEDTKERELGRDTPAFALSFAPTDTWGFTGAFAAADTEYGVGVAAQVGFEYPILINASIRGVAAVAHNAQSYVGLDGAAPGFAWSAALSGRFALSTGLNLVGQVSFADGPAIDGQFQVVGGVHYAPTERFEIGGELFHRNVSGTASNGWLLRGELKF